MSSDRLATLHQMPVSVVTHSGMPVSIGRIVVHADRLGPRVMIRFETESVSCELRVPAAAIPQLLASGDATIKRYALPAGDAFWTASSTNPAEVSPQTPANGKVAAAEPVVETFPLPNNARPTGFKTPADGDRAR